VPNNDIGNFGSLVRFIDDWDKQFNQQQQDTPRNGNGQVQPRQPRRTVQQSYTPRFDVKETEQNYELHGELPGVEKDNVDIEFSDPQTIVIRGRSERTYTEGNPPANLLEGKSDEMSGAIADKPHGEDHDETGSNKSFKATVEDDTEEAEGNTTVAKTSSSGKQTSAASQQQQPKPKYWVYERSVGNFSRSFTFSSHVDHEGVSASLNNGILTVVVPKAKKHQSHRIAVK
jgi:HSP20 family molecular chaperone IbpA